MEIYQTETQQFEAIKQFVQKYRKLFLVTTLIALLLIVGGRYWRHHVQVKNMQASDMYQEMLSADSKHDAELVATKGKTLLDSYSNTPYAQLASLLLAKNAVEVGKLDKAEEHLQWIISQNGSKDLTVHVARERLARVMQERGNLDAALKLLNEAKPSKAYIAIYEEAKGDLYLAKGDRAQAKTAYLKALASVPTGAQAPLLHMKLLDVGVTEQEISAAEGEHNA